MSAYRFRKGVLSQRERLLVQEELSRMVDLGERLGIVDRRTTVESIANLLRSRAAAGRATDLVIIDYLQLLSSVGRYESRVQEVAAISRGLKQITQSFGIPVLALSQLARQEKSQRNVAPDLDWLKESSQLEQDANQVVFLWLKRDAEERDLERQVSWRVAKNRDGALNNGEITFQTKYCRFVETFEESEEAA